MIETGKVMAVSQRGTYLGRRGRAQAARRPHAGRTQAARRPHSTALHFTAAAR